MLMYLEGGSLVMVNRFRHATMTSVFAWQSPAPEDAAKLPKKVRMGVRVRMGMGVSEDGGECEDGGEVYRDDQSDDAQPLLLL